jgi:hypothetical protein
MGGHVRASTCDEQQQQQRLLHHASEEQEQQQRVLLHARFARAPSSPRFCPLLPHKSSNSSSASSSCKRRTETAAARPSSCSLRSRPLLPEILPASAAQEQPRPESEPHPFPRQPTQPSIPSPPPAPSRRYVLTVQDIQDCQLHTEHELKKALEKSMVLHNPPAQKVAHFFRSKVSEGDRAKRGSGGVRGQERALSGPRAKSFTGGGSPPDSPPARPLPPRKGGSSVVFFLRSWTGGALPPTALSLARPFRESATIALLRAHAASLVSSTHSCPPRR